MAEASVLSLVGAVLCVYCTTVHFNLNNYDDVDVKEIPNIEENQDVQDYVNPITNIKGRHKKSGSCVLNNYKCCNIGPGPDVDCCGHHYEAAVE